MRNFSHILSLYDKIISTNVKTKLRSEARLLVHIRHRIQNGSIFSSFFRFDIRECSTVLS